MPVYKVVMLVRKTESEELLNEMKDIDFEAHGVKIEIMEDDFFDSYINVVDKRECHEG